MLELKSITRPLRAYEEYQVSKGLMSWSDAEASRRANNKNLTGLLMNELLWTVIGGTGGENQNIIIYVYGQPGSGKSTLARTLASWLHIFQLEAGKPSNIKLTFGYSETARIIKELERGDIVYKDEGRAKNIGAGSKETAMRIREATDRLRDMCISFIFVDVEPPSKEMSYHVLLESVGHRNGINYAYLYGYKGKRLGYIALSKYVWDDLEKRTEERKKEYMKTVVNQGGGEIFQTESELREYGNILYNSLTKEERRSITRENLETKAIILIPRRRDLVNKVVSYVYSRLREERRKYINSKKKEQMELIDRLINEVGLNKSKDYMRIHFKRNGVMPEYISEALDEYVYRKENQKVEVEYEPEELDIEEESDSELADEFTRMYLSRLVQKGIISADRVKWEYDRLVNKLSKKDISSKYGEEYTVVQRYLYRVEKEMKKNKILLGTVFEDYLAEKLKPHFPSLEVPHASGSPDLVIYDSSRKNRVYINAKVIDDGQWRSRGFRCDPEYMLSLQESESKAMTVVLVYGFSIGEPRVVWWVNDREEQSWNQSEVRGEGISSLIDFLRNY